jgi:hypothetical protein
MPEAYISEYATTLLENAAACQNVWGFTWWCSHDIDPAMKGLLSLEYTRGVLDQQNRVKPLGTTLSTLAEMAEESAGCDFSLRSAGDSRQRAFQKKGGVADWSIAKQYMDLVSRGVQPGNRAGEPCRGQSLSQEQRDRRADGGRSAITRNQHSSTNSIERKQLRPKDQCNNEF